MNLGTIYAEPKNNWRTPDRIYDPLHAYFDFQADLAATAEDSKCPVFCSRIQNLVFSSLFQRGIYRGFINPPYGRALYEIMPIVDSLQNAGMTIAALLPMSTDLEWYHKHVLYKARQYVRRGRIKFDPPLGVTIKRNAPAHGNLLAVYSHEPDKLPANIPGTKWWAI